MVTKKSEYQNQFRATVIRGYQATYLENLNIRHTRRDREYVHTPICWGELIDEGEETHDSDDTAGPGQVAIQQPTVPEKQYQSLAQILEDSSEKARVHRWKKDKTVEENINNNASSVDRLSLEDVDDFSKEEGKDSCVLCNMEGKGKQLSKTAEDNLKDHQKDVGDKAFSINDIVDKENRKLHEKIVGIANDESNIDVNMPDKMGGEANLRKNPFIKRKSKGQKVMNSSDGKSRRSQKKVQFVCHPPEYLPVTQALAAPASKPARLRRPDRQAPLPPPQAHPLESFVDRPPFIGYGSGDVEDNLAVHRTHNVRASADVYGAALKAKLRREAERKLRRKREEQTLRQERLMEKLGEVTPRDAEDWQSEYTKQFAAYEVKEYERAVSARAVIPRVPIIRAVHRGGCMVVHVD